MQNGLFSSQELEVIQLARSLKVLVIGDSCVDRFVYGHCNRLSPEAPVPVLQHAVTREMPGMAANVAKNVEAFCDNVELIAQKEVIEKVRFVDVKSNQHLIRLDSEPCSYDDVFDPDMVVAGYYDLIIISDYDKGFLKSGPLMEFTSSYDNVYVDSKKEDLSCFKNCFIKLNQKEFESAGATVHSSCNVVETCGSNGARYLENVFPTAKVEVFDVSGAGDTFLVAFSIFHKLKYNVDDAVRFANKCASIVVQKKGTYAIKKTDLQCQQD